MSWLAPVAHLAGVVTAIVPSASAPAYRRTIMPRRTAVPLPGALRYLQPFARSLEKLPPDGLNEDVDPSRLEAALRKRLRGLEADAAAAELESDRALLAAWLEAEAPPDHPAYWILGYLLHPDLAIEMIRPPELPSRGPDLAFDVPDGWKMKAVPFQLHLRKGKLIGVITAIDRSTFEFTLNLTNPWCIAPGQQDMGDSLDVRFGAVAGRKYVFPRGTPIPYKRVRYVLSAPGGFADAILDAAGADFEEAPFESRLHTLRLSGPADDSP
jgi:hypothetical protein